MGKGIAIGCGVVVLLSILGIGGCLVIVGIGSRSVEEAKKAHPELYKKESEEHKDPDDHWMQSIETASVMDNKHSISISTMAQNAINTASWTDQPELVIGCNEGKFELRIKTEAITRSGSVRIKFDDKPPVNQRWQESTNYRALYAPNPRQLAEQLKSTSYFAFEFGEFQAGKYVFIFDVRHLDEHLQKVYEVCGERKRKP